MLPRIWCILVGSLTVLLQTLAVEQGSKLWSTARTPSISSLVVVLRPIPELNFWPCEFFYLWLAEWVSLICLYLGIPQLSSTGQTKKLLWLLLSWCIGVIISDHSWVVLSGWTWDMSTKSTTRVLMAYPKRPFYCPRGSLPFRRLWMVLFIWMVIWSSFEHNTRA